MIRIVLFTPVAIATLLGTVLLASRPARAELVATRITPGNVETHRVGGPDADGGLDDWFVGNGTICAVISDPDHESPLSPRGGVLIDLGLCGAGNDQWTVLQPMLNLSRSSIVPVDRVETFVDETSAAIRTRGVFSGVEIVTSYAVERATPRALRVRLRARRIEAGDRFFAVGTILLHPGGQTRPFSIVRPDHRRSRGFAHPASDPGSLRSLLAALSASDLQVLVGGDESRPVSYGVQRLFAGLIEGDAESRALGSFTVTGGHFTLLNTLTRPFWVGRETRPPGWLQFLQLPFMDLTGDRVLEADYRIWVGERADVASITDQLWAGSPRLAGRVDEPEARIHVESAAGSPVTEVRPGADGRFALRLPPGRYVARARAAAGRRAEQPFEVLPEPNEQSLPALVLGAPARVALPRDFVGRLVFLHAENGEAVVFGEDGLGLRVGDTALPSGLEAPFLNLAGAPDDPRQIALEPGAYRVLAVRGPEYALSEVRLEIARGETRELGLAPLERIRPTPGWIATDLHVHSGASFDSSLPQERQIAAFAASGAEVLVATEHDRVFDPGPAIRRAGLAHLLVSVTGVEMTSAFEGGDSPYTSGHLNAFPLVPRPRLARGGAPRLEGRRLRDTLAELRAQTAPPFVQLNHPRPRTSASASDAFLSHLGVVGRPFDPTRPLAAAPNRSLIEPGAAHGLRDVDFDGLELLNGPDLDRYRRVRADWLSLLLQGERRIATASSDSHRLGQIVGLPRTYVRVEDDRLAAFREDELLSALRAGRAWGTTGPLVSARLGEASPGELHAGDQGMLEVSVEAADWVPVSQWRAYVNGELVHRGAVSAGETVRLPLVFARDAFVTIEVEGPAAGVYAEALPGFVPFAFTNPIFVDVDGDGRFEAPGLPRPRPRTLTHPEEPE